MIQIAGADVKEGTGTDADLEKRGFVNRGGKGSHRNFTHPRVARPVTLSGAAGADAKKYQEKAVNSAIVEAEQ